MKYFYIETNKKAHIIAAETEDNARRIVLSTGNVTEDADSAVQTVYEIKPDTFKNEGFVMTRRKMFMKRREGGQNGG